MDKKELWLALSALGVAAASATTTTTAVAAPEQVGVVNKANVAVEGQVPDNASRVLFVGSDVFRNETIRTDDLGQAHLMFLDQSSLTIGPSSELVIDYFTYDPKTDSGDFSITAAKGILRVVGGALSKSGNVTVKTPLGNLGIRGAVVLIDVARDGGEVTACILYGNELIGTTLDASISKSVQEHEQCLVLTADGKIRTEPMTPERLKKMLVALQGPPSDSIPTGHEITLPDNYSGWLRELAGQNVWDRLLDDERFNADVLNRDIDDLAS